MESKTKNTQKARFDTRLPKEQKIYFEKAARLGGYRSLTDFVVMTVQQKASEIIHEREQVIASQKDSEVFFEAIFNASEPNQQLTDAANEFKRLLK